MYILNHAEVTKIFGESGYPAYIIYPAATAKILGVPAILTKLSKTIERMGIRGIFLRFTFSGFGSLFRGLPSRFLSHSSGYFC